MKKRIVEISNPDKILFPKDKITKLDVINYYVEVSHLMLPYLKNRLLSVIRCHDGVKSECFFKKHPSNEKDMVHKYMDEDKEYFYIVSQTELIYQAQMGTMEFHPWGSSITKINNPNMMIFDLDPDKKLPLVKLRDAVKKVKSILDELNLVSFLKTSGGKGYHIVVPFSSTKNWKTFYEFSQKISIYAEQKWPEIFTTKIKKIERKGKILLDYLRNNRGSTCVAPFSIRARENAPISMPISWKNLNEIKPNEVTIKNYKKYLNNAWKNFFEIQQELK